MWSSSEMPGFFAHRPAPVRSRVSRPTGSPCSVANRVPASPGRCTRPPPRPIAGRWNCVDRVAPSCCRPRSGSPRSCWWRPASASRRSCHCWRPLRRGPIRRPSRSYCCTATGTEGVMHSPGDWPSRTRRSGRHRFPAIGSAVGRSARSGLDRSRRAVLPVRSGHPVA